MEDLSAALDGFRKALVTSEHGKLAKYRLLEREAEAMLTGPVVPEMLAMGLVRHQIGRLERAGALVRREPMEPLRLRPYNLPWLIQFWGAHPEPPRPVTAKNLVAEVLDCVMADPGIDVLLTDDLDDFCVSCIKMSAGGCTKDVDVRLKDIRDNHTACRLIGVELGQVAPARALLDQTARRLTDGSPIDPGMEPGYSEARMRWLAAPGH